MKNLLKVLSIIVGLAILPFFFWFLPYLHDRTLEAFAAPLFSIEVPQNTQLVEWLSKVGQQTGNSDHCDYFAGIMLKTSMSKSEAEEYFKERYTGKSELQFLWLNEKNEYTSNEYGTISTLQDWVNTKRSANLVVYIFEVAMTSALDLRCS